MNSARQGAPFTDENAGYSYGKPATTDKGTLKFFA